ncbi:MAG: acylaminoacyl-peptidase, partial [Sediminibacterium sp.]|nr:acylaminoacyl-peptidase [Sediminibacterium sp.]
NFATIFQKFNDAKGYTMDENGSQVAFIAERDSSSKAVQKYYKIYYYKNGKDSAALLVTHDTKGMVPKWAISESAGGGGGRGGGGGGFGGGGGGFGGFGGGSSGGGGASGSW